MLASLEKAKRKWDLLMSQGHDPWKKEDRQLFQEPSQPFEEYEADADPARDMEQILSLEQARAPGAENFYGELGGVGAPAKEAKSRAAEIMEADRITREQRLAEEEAERRTYQAKLQAEHAAVMDYIESACALACADPNAFQDQITRGKFVSAFFPPDPIVKFSMCGSGEPDDCKDAVVKDVLCADGPLMPEAVLARAREYRRQHPGFWERVGKALQDFSRSREHVLSRPAHGGSSGEKESAEKPERQERSSSGCPVGYHSVGGICGHEADPL